MPPAEVIGAFMLQHVLLEGQEVECRLTRSKSAKKLRIKVRSEGIEVVVPEGRDSHEAVSFVYQNHSWVVEQLERARGLRALRRPENRFLGQILFRGEPVAIRVARSSGWQGPNKVLLDGEVISITCGQDSRTAATRSLENWLRKQARQRVEQQVADIATRVKRTPHRIYVMGQRTKWGNCSALGNLSFNWRLIMAPDHVLRYIVTHEMVHLAIPDHSRRFWLTVQSLCPDTERARQWLVANGHRLTIDLASLIATDG